jgi:hypothetical protein
VSSFLDALRAYGPAAGEAERLMLFGQFVGTWNADVVYQPLVGPWQQTQAEWIWGWTLQGRAVQDVYIVPPRAEQARGAPCRVYGTTVRLYDPSIDAWRITWHSPTGGLQTSFVARPVGDEIVLEATDSDTRWIFSEVEESSFRWRAEEADVVVQTMDVRRIA